MGGDGNDSIKNWRGQYVSIDGGSGRDTILSGVDGSTSYCTISGGTGDDRISIKSGKGSNNVFLYNNGDGNDTIDGFNSTSTLSISGSSYSTAESGRDVIVYVGSSSILLREAAYNSTPLNIVEAVAWKLNGTTATYGTSSNTLVTVSGIKSLDGLSISGNVVTISDESALNRDMVTISNGYMLKLGSDVTAPNYTKASWSLSGNTAIYTGASNTAGYELANNQISYVSAKSSDSFTVSSVKSTNGLAVAGNVVTVSNSALNQETVTISNSNYTLALGNDVTQSTTTAAAWNMSGNTAVYTNSAISAGYKLENNQISYVEASGGEKIYISGVKSTDGLSINGNTVTVTADALNKSNITISDGYNLKLQGVDKPSYTEAHFDGTTYKSASNTAGYTLSDNKITYTAAISETDLFTISGVKSTSGITISGKTVTVPNSALNQENVTINGDYELKLGSAPTPTTTAAKWTFSDNVATYTNTGTTAGYVLEDNQIIYVEESSGETVKISGVTSTNGISIDGKKVTVDETALNKVKVTITGGYELELGKVTTPKDTEPTWSLENGIATYKSSGMTAGYVLENNQIIYKEASEGNLSFRISGVTSTSGITIDGKIITVNSLSLGTDKVTISEGYKLNLGDAPIPKNIAASWKLDGTTAIYNGVGSTAGYVLENNEINYVEAKDGETLTINGVISTDGIKINDKEVTISAESLGTETVTITDGYELKLGSEVSKPTTSEPIWTPNNTGAACRVSTTAGYTLAANKITYIQANKGANFTVNGVNGIEGLELNGTTVTVNAVALKGATVTITDGYTLALGDDVNKAATTSATWSYDKGTSTATYTSGLRSAGYLLEENHISYVSEIKSKEVKISGVKSRDGITVTDNIITISASSLNKKPVKVDNEDYTLKLGADVPEPTVKKADWTLSGTTAVYKDTSTTKGYTIEDNQINYIKASGGSKLVTVEGVKDKLGLDIKEFGIERHRGKNYWRL